MGLADGAGEAAGEAVGVEEGEGTGAGEVADFWPRLIDCGGKSTGGAAIAARLITLRVLKRQKSSESASSRALNFGHRCGFTATMSKRRGSACQQLD